MEYPPHCRMMRDAMKQRDWPQETVALVMAQSRSTVNAILTGRRKLTARLAIDYGHVLNLSPEELLRQQDAWLLANLPNMDRILAGVRLRAEMVEARIAGDIQAEIDSLQKQRAAIDDRITHLTGIQEQERRAISTE